MIKQFAQTATKAISRSITGKRKGATLMTAMLLMGAITGASIVIPGVLAHDKSTGNSGTTTGHKGASDNGTNITQDREIIAGNRSLVNIHDSENITVNVIINVNGDNPFDSPRGDGNDTFGDDNDTDTTTQVVFTDQNTTGTSVVVKSATLPDGGFVVIHNRSLIEEGDVTGSVIGVSDKLDAEKTENIEVALAREVEDSQTLMAVLYRDTDGDGEFEYDGTGGASDEPYFNDDGSVVADDAYVAVPEDGNDDNGTDEPSTTAQVDFNTPFRPSPLSSMTLESATLPDGGFVVIHNRSLQDGDVEGSVVGVSDELETGQSEEIEISLTTQLKREQGLFAVLYRDTNADGEFEAGTDKLYLDNGTAVSDFYFLRFPEDAGAIDDFFDRPFGDITNEPFDIPFDDNITNDTDDANETGPIVFTDQVAGQQSDVYSPDLSRTVTVESVAAPDGGFVVIYNMSVVKGEIEKNVLGVSDPLDSGQNEDVEVTLDGVRSFNEYYGGDLTENRTLIAVLYRDGDGRFEFGDDEPYLDNNNTAIADAAYVRVPDDDSENDTAEADLVTTFPDSSGLVVADNPS